MFDPTTNQVLAQLKAAFWREAAMPSLRPIKPTSRSMGWCNGRRRVRVRDIFRLLGLLFRDDPARVHHEEAVAGTRQSRLND